MVRKPPPAEAFTYIVNDNNTITITGLTDEYKSTVTNLVIPSTIEYSGNNLDVTSIQLDAFRDYNNLTGVTIPGSVTTIGADAFMCCKNLESVKISSGVKKIDYNAFYECSNLTSVDMPDSVTEIGSDAFYCCAITSIHIPSGLTKINFNTFLSCTNLASITIPSSVTEIDASAFSNCYALTDVTIPGNVKTIGPNAFACDSNLANVTISSGVETISTGAFSFCGELASVTISNGVKVIGDSAFEDCISLTKVTIPNSVQTIGTNAFGLQCYVGPGKISDIYVKNTRDMITGSPWGAGDATKVHWLDDAPDISYDSEGRFLTGFETDESYTINGNDVTPSADGTLEIDESWYGQTISIIRKSNMYYNASPAQQLTIPSKSEMPTNIGFENVSENGLCDGKITGINDNLEFRAYDATEWTPCSYYPNGEITGLSAGTYLVRTKAPTDYFPSAPVEITIGVGNGGTDNDDSKKDDDSDSKKDDSDDKDKDEDKEKYSWYPRENDTYHYMINTYYNTAWICGLIDPTKFGQEIVFPETIDGATVTSIQYDGMYTDFSQFKSVTIPSGVQFVGGFKDCTNLESITILGTDVSINSGAFENCTNLKNVNIQGGLRDISNDAFKNCDSLESIVLPGEMWGIYSGAFSDCDNLKSIEIPNGIFVIRSGAFDCPSLTSIKIGDYTSDDMKNISLDIESNAFSGCTGLTTVELPSNVCRIGENAFSDCKDLTDVYIHMEKDYISGEPWGADTSKTTIHWLGGTPNLDYDVRISSLTGFTPGESYDINGVVVTPTTDTVAIQADWYGKTLSIQRLASNHYSYGNKPSKVATLELPEQPEAPDGLGTVPVSATGASDGQITGVTSKMEYAAVSTNGAAISWNDCTDGTVTGLPAGMYEVRFKYMYYEDFMGRVRKMYDCTSGEPVLVFEEKFPSASKIVIIDVAEEATDDDDDDDRDSTSGTTPADPTPVTPDPVTPVTPDPTPVTPEPTTPVTPDPTTPATPDQGSAGTTDQGGTSDGNNGSTGGSSSSDRDDDSDRTSSSSSNRGNSHRGNSSSSSNKNTNSTSGTTGTSTTTAAIQNGAGTDANGQGNGSASGTTATISDGSSISQSVKDNLSNALESILKQDSNIQTGPYVRSDSDDISVEIPSNLQKDDRNFYLMTAKDNGDVVILKNDSIADDMFEAEGEADTDYQMIFEDGDTPLASMITDSGILDTSSAADCINHAVGLGLALLGLLAAALLERKGNRYFWLASVAGLALALIATATGSCSLDWIFFAVEAVVAIAATAALMHMKKNGQSGSVE